MLQPPPARETSPSPPRARRTRAGAAPPRRPAHPRLSRAAGARAGLREGKGDPPGRGATAPGESNENDSQNRPNTRPEWVSPAAWGGNRPDGHWPMKTTKAYLAGLGMTRILIGSILVLL